MAGFTRRAKSDSGGKFEAAPAGQHVAVCVAFVDLGTQLETYKGEAPQAVEKIFLAWELTDHVTRPVVGRDFRASLHPKANLRQWLKSWRGGKDLKEDEEFDLTTLVGKKCVLTIEHRTSGDRTFASVVNLVAPMKGLPIPDPEHTPYCWTRMDGTPFRGPDWLPFLYGRPIEEWVASCKEAREVQADRRGVPAGPPDDDPDDLWTSGGSNDDDIPF